MTITDTYTEELAIDLTGSALMPARKGMDVQRIDGEDGSLLVEFSATSSGCLFELVGKNGRLSVDVDEDRLLGRIDLNGESRSCLLYTSPSPRDLSTSRMPSSA